MHIWQTSKRVDRFSSTTHIFTAAVIQCAVWKQHVNSRMMQKVLKCDDVGVNVTTPKMMMYRRQQVKVPSVTVQLYSNIQTIMDDCIWRIFSLDENVNYNCICSAKLFFQVQSLVLHCQSYQNLPSIINVLVASTSSFHLKDRSALGPVLPVFKLITTGIVTLTIADRLKITVHFENMNLLLFMYFPLNSDTTF